MCHRYRSRRFDGRSLSLWRRLVGRPGKNASKRHGVRSSSRFLKRGEISWSRTKAKEQPCYMTKAIQETRERAKIETKRRDILLPSGATLVSAPGARMNSYGPPWSKMGWPPPSWGTIVDGSLGDPRGGDAMETNGCKAKHRCPVERILNTVGEETEVVRRLMDVAGTAKKDRMDGAQARLPLKAEAQRAVETRYEGSEDFSIGKIEAGRREVSGEGVAGIGHCWSRKGGSCWETNRRDNEIAGKATGDCTADPPS